jgi:thiol-disulfide isomerase/thioredoxin
VNLAQRALAVALVVGVGLAAGFLSYRLESGRASPIREPSRVSGASVSPLTDAPGVATPGVATTEAAAPAPRPVPATLPQLELPDLSGNNRALSSFGGRPLIINFWATWCAPCRREIPLLRDLRQRYRPDRLEIVGIAVDFSAAVREYLRHTTIDYPLLVGEQQGLAAAEQFGLEPVLPFSVFADTQGRIVAVKIGELHREEADFILTEIRSVDRGRIDLPEAREQIQARLKALAVERAKAQQNSG